MWGILEFMGESDDERGSDPGGVKRRIRREPWKLRTTIVPLLSYSSKPIPLLKSYPRLSLRHVSRLGLSNRYAGQGIAAALLHKARVTVGGSPSEGNLIKNCDVGLCPSIWMQALSNIHTTMSLWLVIDAAGIGAFQVAYSALKRPPHS